MQLVARGLCNIAVQLLIPDYGDQPCIAGNHAAWCQAVTMLVPSRRHAYVCQSVIIASCAARHSSSVPQKQSMQPV